MRKLVVLFAVLLLPLFFLAGCSSEKAEEVEAENATAVRVYKVQPENISSYIKLTGGVSAVDDANVYSKVSEKITEVKVNTGDRVEKNQVLAVQQNDIFTQGVKLAEAAKRNAKAQLDLARQEFERMQKLHGQKAISQQQFDQAKTAKEAAEAGYEQAVAGYEQAKEQYENSIIKAPFAGKVAAIFFDENDMVPAGQPVVQIVNANGMKSKIKVSSKDIPYIKKGQKVVVTFPSVNDKEYSGYIHDMDQAVDPMSKSLEVEVRLADVDDRIKPGMFGLFYIETETRDSIISVPDNAVLTQTQVVLNKRTGEQEPVKKYFLFTVNDQRAHLKEVKTGIISGGRIEITEGVNFGDQIIVLGQNVVKEDQLVKLVD